MLDLVPLGDRAWIARFINEKTARDWSVAVRHQNLAGITDIVLAYQSVSIHFNPDSVVWDEFEDHLRSLTPAQHEVVEGRIVTLPVHYQGDDLAEVSQITGLMVDEIIELHSAPIYDVFAIGFQPGFPYAGYLTSPLDKIPRRATPRTRVPAGSVAIAAGQTGVYPGEFPGGWHLIGTTPLVIVDLAQGHFPIRAGDRLRFVSIDAAEFGRRRGETLL